MIFLFRSVPVQDKSSPYKKSNLFEQRLKACLRAGLARDLHKLLGVLEGVQVLEQLERHNQFGSEASLEDLLDLHPVARLQRRVAQVRHHWELKCSSIT